MYNTVCEGVKKRNGGIQDADGKIETERKSREIENEREGERERERE